MHWAQPAACSRHRGWARRAFHLFPHVGPSHEVDHLLVWLKYLSRTLAYSDGGEPGLNVLAIDFNPKLIAGSHRFSATSSSSSSNSPPSSKSSISYLVHRITSPTSASDSLSTWLGPIQQAAVIGLHACGGLTDTVLKMFVQEERIKAVVIAGCESSASTLSVPSNSMLTERP